MLKKKVKITIDGGLYARTATTLVNLCMQFDSEISLEVLKKKIDFKSIMGVMSLELDSGSELTITVSGIDENEAINAIIQKIVELKLGKEI